MDGKQFMKLAKDCKLLDKKLTATDIDLIFSKVKDKGACKITYAQFEKAVSSVLIRKEWMLELLSTRSLKREGLTSAEPKQMPSNSMMTNRSTRACMPTMANMSIRDLAPQI